MKTMGWPANGLVLGILLVSGGLIMPAEAIKVGDPSEKVIYELGQPQGRISSGIHDVFLYERGKVELKGGLVTVIELVSPEIAAARRVEKEKRQQEAQIQARESQERHRKEGTQLLADRLADPMFRSQSATDQLAFWNVFLAQYPEIEIGTIYAPLVQQYKVEQEQALVREQLADLQQRTAAAEARARRAEQAAEDAAYWARPTVTYVPLPWVQSYPRYCPPVPASTSPHSHANKHDTSVIHPYPVTAAGAIAPPSSRKIHAVNVTRSGSSAHSTGMPLNVKSGPIFRP